MDSVAPVSSTMPALRPLIVPSTMILLCCRRTGQSAIFASVQPAAALVLHAIAETIAASARSRAYDRRIGTPSLFPFLERAASSPR